MARKNYVCAPPPIESLSEKRIGQSFWPKKLFSQPDFKQHIEVQRVLLQQIRRVFGALPVQQTLAEGLANGLITEQEVESLCILLAQQLESNAVQKRLALYLPFELLCPITFGSASVQHASARLHQAYRLAWESQLREHEVRANYVDGDVLEPALLVGDHPRVVKAAHLIPGLLKVGHMTVADVDTYLQSATEPLLLRSIRDACVVAADLGLLKPDAWTSVQCSPLGGPAPSTGMTKSRARWLASVAHMRTLRERAATIAAALERGAHVTELCSDQESLVALEALRVAALQNATVFRRHRAWLKTLMSTDHGPEVRDSLNKLYAHIYAHGLVGDADLKEQDIYIPCLSGPFYENRHRLEPSPADIVTMCTHVAAHPRLSQLVYPVALIFGSRVKGYGLAEADCDIAIFVRPGVNRSEREYLEQALLQVYNHKRFDGTIKLFWLTETSKGLAVIDWPGHISSDARPGWMYVLFGALWFGEQETIRLLHEQLLSTYFTPPQTMKDDKPTYERWLEEMERDSLQYRLLHKGFERFYPIQSPMHTRNGVAIDGQSAFYDTRYRRIATELFVRRVFLPRLDVPTQY